METRKNVLFSGKTGKFEAVIGLEIHAQILSRSKMFSAAATAFGAEPNAQVELFDAAFPGMLPVLNEFCVEQAVKTGIALGGNVNLTSVFERKNYFYPDLPAGYQITQNAIPIISGGALKIEGSDGEMRTIRLRRLHIENDAGKLTHELGDKVSHVDLNRSGMGLMEMVTDPDLRTAEETGRFIKKLRSILRYLGTCDGNMEEGSLRVDVNLSVRRPGEELGVRAELKNMNSVRFLQQAITYEIARHIAAIESGEKLYQETRSFDPSTGITHMMRRKEGEIDYRYFPDPDLYPLVLTQDFVDGIAAEIPELPDEKRVRFMREYGLPEYDAGVLVEEKDISVFFEQVIHHFPQSIPELYKLSANWITGEVFSYLNRLGLPIIDCPLRPEHLAELIQLCAEGKLSSSLAKEVFAVMWESGEAPSIVMSKKGLEQISDEGDLVKAIQQVLEEDKAHVAEYLSGKEKLFGYFVGQTMRVTKGRGNPQMIQDLLRRALEEKRS